MDDGARFSTQQPHRVSWAQRRALWDSLLPTSRGDNTVPSTFPTESLSTHAPLGQHIREEKKRKRRQKKKKGERPASRSRKCTFQTPTPFPRAGGGKPAISCFPSLPGAPHGTHASRPLTSPLHCSAHAPELSRPGEKAGSGERAGRARGKEVAWVHF